MQCSLIFAALGLIVAIVGVILGFGVFPGLVDDKIGESVELVEGTEQYERWLKIPFPITFKVYMFNVTNPDEVAVGMKPDVKEIGPFIYDQYRVKYNITREDDNLSYYQKQLFEFNSKASHPLGEDDIINVLNVPLHALIQITEMTSSLLLPAIQANLDRLFEGASNLTIITTVRRLLFDGVPLCARGPDTICNNIKKRNSKTMRVAENGTIFFSFFEHKNNSHDGFYRVKTGEKDPKDLAKIIEWENREVLNLWPERGENNTICNMINGTDASIFAPFVSKKDLIQIFNTDICRSVTTRYTQDTKYKGLKAYRFKAYEDMFPAPSSNDSTLCFCANVTKGILQDNGCVKNGAMELFPCLDAHIVATFPHFLMAHEDYQNGVTGLSPDPELHQISLDIEPNTGVPLQGGKRLQFSMFLRPVNRITITSQVNTTLLPILWVDEGLELPDDLIDLLNESLFDVLVILDAVTWTLVAVGAATAIGCIVFFLMRRKKVTKDPASSFDNFSEPK